MHSAALFINYLFSVNKDLLGFSKMNLMMAGSPEVAYGFSRPSSLMNFLTVSSAAKLKLDFCQNVHSKELHQMGKKKKSG